MSIVLLDQVKAMLRSVISITDRSIAKAQEGAAKATATANAATEAANAAAGTANAATETANAATETANAAAETANATQKSVAGKMDANNPVGTGSFSMGRRAGSDVGVGSHAEGQSTTASGDYSHAEGSWTTASGKYSHAEGYYSDASAIGCHAEGGHTTASNQYSHAEGYKTTASGFYSHAEGQNTTASSQGAHAEGASTTASGTYSHAEGYKTTAFGSYSHAEGEGTVAGSLHQHVQGSYNIQDANGKYIHIVGNGDYNNGQIIRSNCHTIDRIGNAWFAGDVYVGGGSRDDSEKLVAQSQLDALITEIATLRAATTPTVLWSASDGSGWTSGSITAEGIQNWYLVAIQTGLGQVLGMNTGNEIRASGVLGGASNHQSVNIDITVDGSTLTLDTATRIIHNASSSHGTSNTTTITGITGLLKKGA